MTAFPKGQISLVPPPSDESGRPQRGRQSLESVAVELALNDGRSVKTLVVLVMSDCTRATRTRSAGSGSAARMRCA
jgi:hypothetical protein